MSDGETTVSSYRPAREMMDHRMGVATGRDELADYRSPLLYQQWYVAGLSQDFGRCLIERTFLNQSVVLYRSQQGQVVALQNRCAHRSYPLSKSWLEDDGVRCRYHGAKYNDCGVMIDLPCQSPCPRVSLRKYQTYEVGPLVWIWMGDPARADVGDVPDTSWLDVDQGWEFMAGATRIEGNYLLMMENLMDLSHIPYLHRETFGYSEAYAATKVKVEIAGHSLRYYREDVPAYHRMGFFPPSVTRALDDVAYSSSAGGEFVSPAMMFGRGEIFVKNLSATTQKSYLYRVPHFLTPETQYSTHYWFGHARNFAQSETDYTKALGELLKTGFAEDKVAIEGVQQLLLRDSEPFREVHYRADKPTVSMRRIVQSLINEETALLGN